MKIKQIPELKLSTLFIKKLTASGDDFYLKKDRPKIKFGRPQVDKNGVIKNRPVVSPIPVLKYKQWQINSYLKTIELPSSMFGGIKDRNNIKNAWLHRGGKYFLTVDLREFFKNISNKQVHQTFQRHGFSWEEARILTRLTTFKGSLPQGAPTSTTIANLTFSRTALILEDFCRDNEVNFTNFVDDLTFSSKKDFEYLIPQLLSIIRQGGFRVNNNKIHYRRKTCEVTGLFIQNGQLNLAKEMLLHAESRGIKGYVAAVVRQNSFR